MFQSYTLKSTAPKQYSPQSAQKQNELVRVMQNLCKQKSQGEKLEQTDKVSDNTENINTGELEKFHTARNLNNAMQSCTDSQSSNSFKSQNNASFKDCKHFQLYETCNEQPDNEQENQIQQDEIQENESHKNEIQKNQIQEIESHKNEIEEKQSQENVIQQNEIQQDQFQESQLQDHVNKIPQDEFPESQIQQRQFQQNLLQEQEIRNREIKKGVSRDDQQIQPKNIWQYQGVIILKSTDNDSVSKNSIENVLNKEAYQDYKEGKVILNNQPTLAEQLNDYKTQDSQIQQSDSQLKKNSESSQEQQKSQEIHELQDPNYDLLLSKSCSVRSSLSSTNSKESDNSKSHHINEIFESNHFTQSKTCYHDIMLEFKSFKENNNQDTSSKDLPKLGNESVQGEALQKAQINENEANVVNQNVHHNELFEFCQLEQGESCYMDALQDNKSFKYGSKPQSEINQYIVANDNLMQEIFGPEYKINNEKETLNSSQNLHITQLFQSENQLQNDTTKCSDNMMIQNNQNQSEFLVTSQNSQKLENDLRQDSINIIQGKDCDLKIRYASTKTTQDIQKELKIENHEAKNNRLKQEFESIINRTLSNLTSQSTQTQNRTLKQESILENLQQDFELTSTQASSQEDVSRENVSDSQNIQAVNAQENEMSRVKSYSSLTEKQLDTQDKDIFNILLQSPQDAQQKENILEPTQRYKRQDTIYQDGIQIQVQQQISNLEDKTTDDTQLNQDQSQQSFSFQPNTQDSTMLQSKQCDDNGRQIHVNEQVSIWEVGNKIQNSIQEVYKQIQSQENHVIQDSIQEVDVQKEQKQHTQQQQQYQQQQQQLQRQQPYQFAQQQGEIRNINPKANSVYELQVNVLKIPKQILNLMGKGKNKYESKTNNACKGHRGNSFSSDGIPSKKEIII